MRWHFHRKPTSFIHTKVVNAGSTPSTMPFICMYFALLILAKNQGKYSFYTELSLTSYKVGGEYFDFRYKNGNAMSTYLVLNSTTKSYYFLLGYRPVRPIH